MSKDLASASSNHRAETTLNHKFTVCEPETTDRGTVYGINAWIDVQGFNRPQDCRIAEVFSGKETAKLIASAPELKSEVETLRAVVNAHEIVQSAIFESLPECEVWANVPDHITSLRSINAELVGALRKAEHYLNYYNENRELGKGCAGALETVRAALKAASCE